MRKLRSNDGVMTAARRGQIIQRVLVDGWTPGRAAAEFRVSERQVASWVAAYRRRGMASLRPAAIRSLRTRHPWVWRLRSALGRLFHRVHSFRTPSPQPAPCVALRHDGGDRRRHS